MRLTIAVVQGDYARLRYRPARWVYENLRARLRDGSFTDDSRGLDNERWADLDRQSFQAAFTVSAPESMTVKQLTRHCVNRARLRRAARLWPARRIWLADPVTDDTLPADQRLDVSGLADGDLVVLYLLYPPKASYLLLPAPNTAELIRRLQLTENTTAPDAGPRLWGALLYTDADTELATYVRTHFDDLNALSGPSTRIFVVERKTDWSRAKKYWRRHLEPELYRVLSTMRWLRWQPYDPQGAYEIAGLLGLDPALLPCLVLFHPAEAPLHQSEKIVFRIEEATPRYFRSLFGGLATVLRPVNGGAPPDTVRLMEERDRGPRRSVFDGAHHQRGPCEPGEALNALATPAREADAAAFARVGEAVAIIRSSLWPAVPANPGHTHTFNNCRVVVTSGAAVSENFYFQGTNTTFINRPADTVIRDFQKTYASGIGGDELTRLLELVLYSRDLSDVEREEAAGAVHDLARITAEPELDVPAIPSRLERLRELLAGAADIAQPALAIVASVAALFPG
ncbi:hypothetical protein [Streptomyces coeruleorubidus]|uniref:hypothetical protein n=1 Tax=Streptomyces coeruleorubidus TaxID=116188 RepID=UPI0033C5A800